MTSVNSLPTLDEVARVAGVSRATASRAINGGSRVSASARQRVDDAVRSLGYVPNPAARSLVTRRTDSVAVIVPEPDDRIFSDPFFARTLRGVDRMLAANDLQLVLRQRQARMDPQTIEVVRRNMAIIDQAIREAQSALAADPANGDLNQAVSAAYKTKINLLRRAVELPART